MLATILMNLIKKADEKIFGALLWATQTKAAFYVLLLVIIIATILQPPIGVFAWLMLTVSIGYQGVALPGVGYAGKQAEKAANEQGEMTRKLLKETHDAVRAEFNMLRKELKLAREERAEMKKVLAKLGCDE